MSKGVDLEVVRADVFGQPSDLLVLKYAQRSYGVDAAAVEAAGIDESALPRQGSRFLVREPSGLACRNLLFLGVEPIGEFVYRSVRDFSRRALAEAAEIMPAARTIAMTLHGAGFGLDEAEAFDAEIAGIVEALDAGEYPDALRTVSIVEVSERRTRWMKGALAKLLGG